MTGTTPPDSRSLIDFSNHGTLPFVARERELERLVAFWQGTAEAQELRAALVTGESGVGKSRLLQELVPRVTALGGVVVHARLYPGASTSIAPIIARAMRFSGVSRGMLKKEPEDDIASVIGGLERMSRLRPVLVAVEDLHILSGEALAEFAVLLEALGGEGMSILAFARPMDLPARSLLERYLVEEIELKGFDEEGIEALWRELFATPPESEMIAVLARHTLGNALALRSTLRGALKSGALARDAAGIWRSSIPMQQFGEALDRNVRLLAEGMAAHLTEEERRAAGLLATLGEVFSREAGRLMIAPNEHLMDVLAFKGIVAEASPSILPLPGGSNVFAPLVFTHALLHRHLVELAEVDADRLVRVGARRLPLYSVLPWQLLAEHEGAIGLGRDELAEWIERSIDRALALDGTPDWAPAMEIIRAVEAVFEARARMWDAEATCVRARILTAKLELNLRADHTPEFLEEAGRLLDLTEAPDCVDRLETRLLAFKYLVRGSWRSNYARCREIWEHAEASVVASPALRFTRAYVDLLETMASVGWAIPDEGLLRSIEARLDEIMASSEAGDGLKDRAWRSIPRFFLNTYDDAAELDERLRLVADLERRLGANDVTLGTLKVPLYESIGMPEELHAAIALLAPRLKEQGLMRQYYQCRIIDICRSAWFAADTDGIVAAALRLRGEMPEALRGRFDLGAGFRLLRFALLRGEYEHARAVAATFMTEAPTLHLGVMLAAGEGRLRDALDVLVPDDTHYADLLSLARLLRDGTENARAAAYAEMRQAFAAPILCVEDLTGVVCLLDMMRELAADPTNAAFVEDLSGDIRDVLGRAFAWMAERSFFGVLEPLLARHGHFLGERERARWGTVAAGIRAAYGERRRSAAADARPRLTMLGTIALHRPGEEPVRPRGARLRTVLGLMVADRMLDTPLGYREFCRLASGGEDDPERARKMVSMAVLRLRESIGLDMIRTVGETPELDVARLQVDLLDAQRLLREATRAARSGGGLKRAFPLLLEALVLVGGEVPFPKLYDDFFEALRADFDYTLRAAVIEVGSGLLREGDPSAAEEVLRRGSEAMPEDEEIADLLRRALEAQGKRVEAERMRMRTGEEE